MQHTTNYSLNKPEGSDYAKVEALNENADKLDSKIKEIEDVIISNNTNYAVATGTNTYVVTINGISSLVEGMSLKVKFANSNTAASTLNINSLGAKSIVKSNGGALSSGYIKPNQVLHLVYTGVNFQLLGEGGEYGTATAAQVLEGYSIGTESGLVQGGMANKGAVNHVLPINGVFPIPAGYHNGNGKITQSVVTKSEEIIVPSTFHKYIYAGQYLSGNQTILGDTDLLAHNIREGVEIFGVTGTVNISNLGGRKFAGGTTSMSGSAGAFTHYNGVNNPSCYFIQISGLSFRPNLIISICRKGIMKFMGVYSNLIGEDANMVSQYTESYSTASTYYLKGNNGSQYHIGYVTYGGFLVPVVPPSNSGVESLPTEWYAFE